jgi:hypothetical protein
VTSNLNGGDNDNPTHPVAVPAGEKWVISAFGAADIQKTDPKSTLYILRFGSDIIKVISATGDTYNIAMKHEITGDGAKQLNVQRFNFSSDNKPCPFWIEAYKRG